MIGNNTVTATSRSDTTALVGALRFNGTLREIEVYNGASWGALTTLAGRSPYPIKKEESIDSLCDRHPGLAELKKELDAAQEKFDAYLALIRE